MTSHQMGHECWRRHHCKFSLQTLTVLVAPKGDQDLAHFPCLSQLITEDEFCNMCEKDQCPCIKSTEGRIYFQTVGIGDMGATFPDRPPRKYVGGFLSNRIEVVTAPENANCDHALLNKEGSQTVYNDVRALLHTTKYNLVPEPMFTLAMQQEEEERIQLQEELKRSRVRSAHTGGCRVLI